ncbi:hypothetical protein WJX79_004288 [Trebouxia sp. C0005]
MSTESFDPNSMLSDLLSWDCEAAGMRGSQPFVSILQEVDRYSSAPSRFEPTPMPKLSETPSALFTTDSTRTTNRSERKLEINRISQKRVRERRKARMQSTEAQLAETAAQLQLLKSTHKQLEARNTLLEKVADIHRQPAAFVVTNNNPWSWQESGLMTESSDKGRSIKVTINGCEQIYAADEVSQMPELLYADLYARYANKLGSCLLETSEDVNSPANRQLAKWVSEVTSLMVCMAQGNPKVALKHGLADFTSSTHANQADPTHRQDAFFLDLMVALELTERQQQDMMYLRRLLFSKLGQIYRDRKVVLNGMPTEGDGICCSSDKLGDMTQSAEELRNSGAEELTTYMQFSSAFYRGIQTCRQHAIAIVHSYPAIPEKGRLLEVMADQRGEPSKEVLMQSAGMDSLQHAANWQQVVDYLQYINAENLNQHVPLLVE